MKALAATLLLLLAAVLSVTAATTTVYQCPMHPWIRSDKPGDKCTLCGMELVAAPAGDSAADLNLVTLTPAGASVIGVQTAAITRAPLVRTLHVAGTVEDDDTRHRIISARVPGRVEKLFVNYVGAEVREGEPLATVYSPGMLTAQRQYVERLKGGTAFPPSERAMARERLLDLGLTPEEIDILEHTLEPTAMVNIRAPMSGTVVARHVYEGQELNKDQTESETRLFEIADFSSMWFVFDAYEPDLRTARRDFEPFSTGLADVARAQHLHHREGMHIFQCPMSPVLGTGRWLSRTARVRNPFFGSAMPECGDELN